MNNSGAEDPAIDDLLVEMSYAWEDIERYFLENPIMDPMDGALAKAFRAIRARLADELQVTTPVAGRQRPHP